MIDFRKTRVEVSLDNIAHNVGELRRLAHESSFFCPMIKANAYGHGDIEVARRLESIGVRHFGVAMIEEGIRLRQNGIKGDILLFGMFAEDGVQAVIDNKLTPMISSWDQLDQLELGLDEQASFPVHLKFNTGMNRFGFDVDEAMALKQHINASTKVDLQGICTHLMTGEDATTSPGDTEDQLLVFTLLQTRFGEDGLVYHALNSAAMLAISQKQQSGGHPLEHWLQGVRPGLAVYGAYPPVANLPSIELKAAMSLKSQLDFVQKVKKGQRVSYGGKWRASRDSLIGVIPIGYADGYSRALSSKGYVLYRGQRVPVVGMVCMDYTLVDITEAAAAATPHRGEEVVLMGQQEEEEIRAEELAQLIGTIPYEIMTGIGSRVPRDYV